MIKGAAGERRRRGGRHYWFGAEPRTPITGFPSVGREQSFSAIVAASGFPMGVNGPGTSLFHQVPPGLR